MQKLFFLILCLIAPSLFAGEPEVNATTTSQATSTLPPVPIDYINTETAYVFESGFSDSRHDFSKQDSWENNIEYAQADILELARLRGLDRIT